MRVGIAEYSCSQAKFLYFKILKKKIPPLLTLSQNTYPRCWIRSNSSFSESQEFARGGGIGFFHFETTFFCFCKIDYSAYLLKYAKIKIHAKQLGSFPLSWIWVRLKTVLNLTKNSNIQAVNRLATTAIQQRLHRTKDGNWVLRDSCYCFLRLWGDKNKQPKKPKTNNKNQKKQIQER